MGSTAREATHFSFAHLQKLVTLIAPLMAVLVVSTCNAETYEIDLTSLLTQTRVPTVGWATVSYNGPEGSLTKLGFQIEGSTTGGLLLCNMCWPPGACPDDTTQAPVMLRAFSIGGTLPFEVLSGLSSEDNFQLFVSCLDQLAARRTVVPGDSFAFLLLFAGENSIPECRFDPGPTGEVTSVKFLFEVAEEQVAVAHKTWGGIKSLFR